MDEKTFLTTFTAIMVASLPTWACGLLGSATSTQWTFLHGQTALGAVFWIPLSILAFIALWILRNNCRCKPALLAVAIGIVPYSIVTTMVLLEVIEPVFVALFRHSLVTVSVAFTSLLLVVHGIYVATSYVIAGGELRSGLRADP